MTCRPYCCLEMAPGLRRAGRKNSQFSILFEMVEGDDGPKEADKAFVKSKE